METLKLYLRTSKRRIKELHKDIYRKMAKWSVIKIFEADEDILLWTIASKCGWNIVMKREDYIERDYQEEANDKT